MEKYDVIIVGSGSAASKPAKRAAAKGKKVAIIEKQDVGGTCALRGCMPKKVYLSAAKTVHQGQRLKDKGIKTNQNINWEKIQEWKQTFTTGYNKGIRQGFENKNIDIIEGEATFTDVKTLRVNNTAYHAQKIVIATGAKPRPLSFKGNKYLRTSQEFLSLKQIPESIIFVGGGYISFEFAHIARQAGADITILQRDNKPLRMFEREIVDILLDVTEKEGINVELEQDAKEIKKEGNKYTVLTETDEYTADYVVHGAGRVPAIDRLNLEKTGVDFGRRGIKTDETLETTQKGIYAGGDCSDTGFPLTPIASIDGAIIAHNLFSEKKHQPDYTATATALFTQPPVASVGMQEKEAREKGHSVEVNTANTTSWFTSKHLNVKGSGYKVIIDKETDQVLGANIMGHNADELINIFSVAIRNNITRKELKKTVWAYPTATSDIDYMI